VSKLHQHTAYGFARPRPDKASILYVTRKPVDAFTRRADIESVADPGWREKMLAAVQDLPDGTGAFKAAVAAFAATHGVRRLRVHIARFPETMIPIYHRHEKGAPEAKPYKHYPRGGNYCAEIYCLDKGEDAGDWGIEIISNHHAHQKDFTAQWRKDHPTAKLVMRLHINDMVAYKEDGATRICRVQKFAPGLVYFLDHRLATDEGDRLSRKLSPRQMQKFSLRKISVDILGRVRDPLRAISYRRAA
jgi:CRISPR-associated endonuclease Csn1